MWTLLDHYIYRELFRVFRDTHFALLLQTMMISHPCGSVARMKEEKFWHCAHRLHNMLADGAVLPGGGATEQACAAVLQCDKTFKSEFSIQIVSHTSSVAFCLIWGALQFWSSLLPLSTHLHRPCSHYYTFLFLLTISISLP